MPPHGQLGGVNMLSTCCGRRDQSLAEASQPIIQLLLKVCSNARLAEWWAGHPALYPGDGGGGGGRWAGLGAGAGCRGVDRAGPRSTRSHPQHPTIVLCAARGPSPAACDGMMASSASR